MVQFEDSGERLPDITGTGGAGLTVTIAEAETFVVPDFEQVIVKVYGTAVFKPFIVSKDPDADLFPAQALDAVQLSGPPVVDQVRVVEFVGRVILIGLAEIFTEIGEDAHLLPSQAVPATQPEVTVTPEPFGDS
jgi:hypothetical protein